MPLSPSVVVKTAPHDLDDRLVRVLVIASHYINKFNDDEYARNHIVELRGIEHVLHAGRQTVEVYVLDENMSVALHGLFFFLTTHWAIDQGDLTLTPIMGRSFRYDRYREWFEAFDIERKGGSPFRPL